MNTIIGFSCSIGINLMFNSGHDHHEEADEISVHVHAIGKKHFHQDEAKKIHDKAANAYHKPTEHKDNCCTDEVTQIAQFDKSLPRSLNAINPVFFLTVVTTFHLYECTFSSQVARCNKYFVQNYHPPIPDIRLVVHRFQI